MGMFDYVNTPAITCPECSGPIRGFQSKSGACVCDTVEWFHVPNFYTPCKQCDAWIDFELVPQTQATPTRQLEHYIVRASESMGGQWRRYYVLKGGKWKKPEGSDYCDYDFSDKEE